HFFLPLCLLFMFNQNASAQCVADAGADIVICSGWWGIDTNHLGGEPVAIGGEEPYTYAWETTYTDILGTFTASVYLDDTTLANPSVVYMNTDELTFILHVIDDDGATCTDTLNVMRSHFDFVMEPFVYNIQQGDSVWLSGSTISGGIPPYEYQWQPSHGLSDSTSFEFWAKPDTTTFYSVIITDSAGCSNPPDFSSHHVFVNPVSVEESGANILKMNLFPNPTRESVRLQFPPSFNFRADVSVYNIAGQIIIQHPDFYSMQNLPLPHPAGMYVVECRNGDDVVRTRVVVE